MIREIYKEIAKTLGGILLVLAVVVIAVVSVGVFADHRATPATPEVNSEEIEESHDRTNDSQSETCVYLDNGAKQSMAREVINQKSTKEVQGVPLLVLMYHNIVPSGHKQNKYMLSVDTLEGDLRWLTAHGYQTLNLDMLRRLGRGELAEGKYCLLTFDDGYYTYDRFLPDLMEKYDSHCVVSLVGEYIDQADEIGAANFGYLDSRGVKNMVKNGRVDIASHSYGYHHIKNHHIGIGKWRGESDAHYTDRVEIDTLRNEQRLLDLGIECKAYAYPYGEFCGATERVMTQLGYDITFTCTEKMNYVKVGQPNCLHKLHRVNRDLRFGDIGDAIGYLDGNK